jgi:hypothetical protein
MQVDELISAAIGWLKADAQYKKYLTGETIKEENVKEVHNDEAFIDRFSVKHRKVIIEAINQCMIEHERAGSPGVTRGQIMHYARTNYNIHNRGQNWTKFLVKLVQDSKIQKMGKLKGTRYYTVEYKDNGNILA